MSAKNTLDSKRHRREQRAAANVAVPTHRSTRCLACEELLVLPVGHTICRPCLADVVTDMVVARLEQEQAAAAAEAVAEEG